MASYKNQTEMLFIDPIKQKYTTVNKHKAETHNFDHLSQH